MWLTSFKENSGDQNFQLIITSMTKMNNVPSKHYEHIMSRKFLFHCHKQSEVEYVFLISKYIAFD